MCPSKIERLIVGYVLQDAWILLEPTSQAI